MSERKKLMGWKEIGAHLGVSDRTARRWEANGLPVHRLFPEQKSVIYAWEDELDAWFQKHSEAPVASPRIQRGIWGAVAGAVVLVIMGALWISRPRGVATEALVAIPLTLSKDLDYSPAISPDGLRMAFARYKPGNPKAALWLYDFATGKERQLTTPQGTARGPAWSPDGRTLAYVRSVSEFETELMIVNLESQQEKVLTKFSRNRSLFPRGQEVAWMPGGKSILYARQVEGRRNAELWAYDLPTGSERLIERQEGMSIANPSYSPDGKKLGYLRRSSAASASESTHQLFIVEVDDVGKPIGPAKPYSRMDVNCASFFWVDAHRVLRVVIEQRSRRLELVRTNSNKVELLPIPEHLFYEAVYHSATERLVYSRFTWDLDNIGYEVVDGRVAPQAKAYAQTKDNEFSLAFHPEDRRAAVASGGRGPSEVFVVSEDGLKRQVSQTGSELASEICWGTGKEELFHLALVKGKLRLFQLDLVEGTTMERLPKLNFNGILKADAKGQYLWATIDDHKLIRIDRETWNYQEISQDVRHLAVSPDGILLYALRGDSSLWKIDPESKREEKFEVPASLLKYPVQNLAASRKRLWAQRKVSGEVLDLVHFTFSDRTWRETGFRVNSMFPSLAVRPDDSEVGVVVFINFDSDLIETRVKL